MVLEKNHVLITQNTAKLRINEVRFGHKDDIADTNSVTLKIMKCEQ